MTPILRRRERTGDIRFCVRIALLIFAPVAMWSTIVLLLPDAAGRFVLGERWAGARSVLPWMCLEYLFLGLATPTTLWLRGNCFRIGLPMPRCWGSVDPRPRSWDPQPAMSRLGSRRRLPLALGQVGWSCCGIGR